MLMYDRPSLYWPQQVTHSRGVETRWTRPSGTPQIKSRLKSGFTLYNSKNFHRQQGYGSNQKGWHIQFIALKWQRVQKIKNSQCYHTVNIRFFGVARLYRHQRRSDIAGTLAWFRRKNPFLPWNCQNLSLKCHKTYVDMLRYEGWHAYHSIEHLCVTYQQGKQETNTSTFDVLFKKNH